MTLAADRHTDMEVKVIIQSKELSKEELRLLIQSIRDCEQKSFPDKEILVLIEAPELRTPEMNEILSSITPHYRYGPMELFFRKKRKKEAK